MPTEAINALIILCGVFVAMGILSAITAALEWVMFGAKKKAARKTRGGAHKKYTTCIVPERKEKVNGYSVR